MKKPKLQTLLQQWSKDIKLIVFITLYLSIFRLILFILYRDLSADSVSPFDYLNIAFAGFRIDVATAAVWSITTFVASSSCLIRDTTVLIEKLRKSIMILFSLLTPLILISDIAYFYTFGDHYNNEIFGLILDETGAVLTTIWKEYHPLLIITGSAILSFITYILLRTAIGYSIFKVNLEIFESGKIAVKFSIVLSVLLAFISALRGFDVYGAPLQVKDVFVTNDITLNRLSINPYRALYETYRVYEKVNINTRFDTIWPSGDLMSAAKVAYPEKLDKISKLKDLDGLFATAARGTNKNPPKHVFLVVMESYSGWTVLPQYQNLGVSKELVKLANSGIYLQKFLPGGSGTIKSLNVLVTGMPDVDLFVQYESTSKQVYPTAIAENFKRLGYRTRFFFGGYLGWQRLDSFIHTQGFDEVYGATHIGVESKGNEWGVNDEHLFDFVSRNIPDETASFNLILTTSNHPPFDLDLEALNFKLSKHDIPAEIKILHTDVVKMLGHHWYADQQLGKFVSAIERQHANALFAITGDHSARMQIKFPGDNVYEPVSVPFVLYGPDSLKNININPETAGTHLNIPATLIELSAPQGFEYFTYADDLLRTKQFQFGYNYMISDNSIASYQNPSLDYPLPGSETPSLLSERLDAEKTYKAMYALSWFRIRKGNKITAY